MTPAISTVNVTNAGIANGQVSMSTTSTGTTFTAGSIVRSGIDTTSNEPYYFALEDSAATDINVLEQYYIQDYQTEAAIMQILKYATIAFAALGVVAVIFVAITFCMDYRVCYLHPIGKQVTCTRLL